MAQTGTARPALLSMVLLFALLTPSTAVGDLVNGDWSTGDESGWTQWSAPWGSDEDWQVTSSGASQPEGALALPTDSQGSFGWFQRIAAPPGAVETIEADWSGSIGGAGWAEVMWFSVPLGTSDTTIISRIDGGSPGDIAYKKDSWGMNDPTTWGWQAASLSPHPQGNGGRVQNTGDLVVALKLGSTVLSDQTWASFDNIVVGRDPAMLVWTGTTDSTWDINQTPNWSHGGMPCTYREGDYLTFDDTATGATQVNLTVTVNPAWVVVNSDATPFELAGLGSFAGPCGLTKRGVAMLTLATGNTYSGDTQIQGGTLVVAADSALGAGAVELGDTTGMYDASLLVAGPFTVDRHITVQDDGSGWCTCTLGGTNTSGTAVFSGEITLETDLTLTAAPGGEVRLEGTLDNAGGNILTKVGAGTVILDGIQTHGPGALLDILDGTVWLNTDAGSGGADLSVSVTGAELYFGCNQHLDTLTVGDGGKVVFAGANVVVLNHLVMNGVDLGAAVLTPEPATLALLALGAMGVLVRRRRA